MNHFGKQIKRWLTLTLMLVLWSFTALAEELPVLARGVNLSHWLQYDGRQPVMADDMSVIWKAGFDHVRIPVDPVYLGWNPDQPSVRKNQFKLARLDQAIKLALDANLAVILDIHPQATIHDRLETEPAMQQAFLNLWQMLAVHYAHFPVDKLAFELLNEPQYYRADGAKQWEQLQTRIVASIRRYAPRHLLLLSGIQGGSIAGLLSITPTPAVNVRYVFHFYDPHLFTHLNAPWEPFISGPQGMMTGLTYPAKNMLNSLRLLPGANQSLVNAAVRDYLNEDWGTWRIDQEITKVASWAQTYGVRLSCTEFGALHRGPDALSRQRWLNDMRSAMTTAGIGWTIWDYADLFGIATVVDGWVTDDGAVIPKDPLNPHRQFDNPVLTALGMTVQP
jgi:endoglucanase